MKYLVVNCPFNRAWYPDLVGKLLDSPPGFAIVETVNAQL